MSSLQQMLKVFSRSIETRLASTLHGTAHLLKNTRCISNTSCCLNDPSYQVFRRCNRCFMDKPFKNPHKKKSKGDRSGDRAGHAIGPPRPIQPPGKVACRCALTSMLKCAGTPSC
ncbi:hypothetical protein TNCV_1694481 [Trichonephila clavipes]|nr:hypothetical protein TNCV_1694481 [Trichonephila clavipes]